MTCGNAAEVFTKVRLSKHIEPAYYARHPMSDAPAYYARHPMSKGVRTVSKDVVLGVSFNCYFESRGGKCWGHSSGQSLNLVSSSYQKWASDHPPPTELEVALLE